AAHHAAVAVIRVGRQGVDVGHQPVAKLVVPGQRRVDLAALVGQFVDLAERQFAVAAEQRAEGAKLEPAQVQLLPLGPVGRVLALVALLDREAADVGGPGALGHVDIGVQVRFGGVHPPGVDAIDLQVALDLLPVDVAGFLRIGIVER
ncbi:conserved hypothetical protein, partial [Ricinus communis]